MTSPLGTTTNTEYGVVAKLFHWLIVVLLLIQFAIAWTMPDVDGEVRPEGLVSLHLSFGTLILVVTVLRLHWRLRYPVKLVSDGVPRWQYRSARIAHALLYALLVALPLLGWANASSRGWAPSISGLFTLPQILPTGSAFGDSLGDVHVLTAYALLAVVGVHVAATLYHVIWLRDRTLARMML